MRRPDTAAEIPTPRRPDRLPTVLARAEVERLLKAVGDLKLRTALMTIYSAGLRISEAMRLTAQDIDSARMVICVRQPARMVALSDVEQAGQPGASLSEVARRYGIAARVLFRWKQESKPSAVPTFVTVQIADASAPFDATLSQEERAP